MDEKPKRKRAPITPIERFTWIAAFVICLVVGFVGFHLLLVTGGFCALLLIAACLLCVYGMTVVVDHETEAEKARQNEAYIARSIVNEDAPIFDETPKQDLTNSL